MSKISMCSNTPAPTLTEIPCAAYGPGPGYKIQVRKDATGALYAIYYAHSGQMLSAGPITALDGNGFCMQPEVFGEQEIKEKYNL